MTADEIIEEIRPLGSESYKRVMRNHGVKEPFFGVKIGDLRKLVRRIKNDYRLALDLYESGNYDAMYLAGLIADDEQMTPDDLERWVANAYCGGLCGVTVPSVAAGSAHGWELGLKWIDSETSSVAVAGWATLANLVSIIDDSQLDHVRLRALLHRVCQTIHQEPDQVRYHMNGFVIATGSCVRSLTDLAIEIAEQIGPVEADLGNNSCQTPYAADSIRKVQDRGCIGKKRKSAKC